MNKLEKYFRFLFTYPKYFKPLFRHLHLCCIGKNVLTPEESRFFHSTKNLNFIFTDDWTRMSWSWICVPYHLVNGMDGGSPGKNELDCKKYYLILLAFA